MQSRNKLFLPPCVFLRKLCRYSFGEDRKSRSSDCFSVVASLSIHRFDRALAYDVFSILLVVFVFITKKKKKIGENLQNFFCLLAY